MPQEVWISPPHPPHPRTPGPGICPPFGINCGHQWERLRGSLPPCSSPHSCLRWGHTRPPFSWVTVASGCLSALVVL